MIKELIIRILPSVIIRYRVNTVSSQKHKEMVLFYKSFVEKDDLVFDVGANIGNRTSVFNKIGCKVVAFEPQQLPFLILRRLYGTKKNIAVIQKGLSDIEGLCDFFICDNASTTSTMSKDFMRNGLFPDFTWQQPIKVPVTTLDQMILEQGTPRLIKIDVEGYEYNVLKGLTKKVRYISFEYTPSTFELTKSCIDYLSEIGYKEFNYSIGESMVLHNWVDKNTLLNNPDLHVGVFGDVYSRDHE